MKILVFNWRDITHPWAGGAELHIHEIAKQWAKQGHRVTLFSSTYNDAKKFEVIDGIEIIRRGGCFSVYVCAMWYYLTNLRRRNYDIVVDDINGVPFFTPLFCRRPKVAIIHHLVKKIFFKELPLYLAVVGWIAERLIPLFYVKTKFITVSRSSKEEAERFGIRGIEIVPNGVDLEFYKPNPNSKTSFPTILFLGRLKRYKRLEHLLKAFEIVSRRVKAELWIVGEGDAKEELEKLAEELGIQDRIRFFGFVKEELKVELLDKAWFFVMTSEKEGWGLTVIEANACGTPCIAYDVPGLRDSINHGYNGLLVKDGDVEALADAIVKLLLDDNLREELSINAVEWSEQFSWDKSTEEFLKVIEGVLNEKAKRSF